VIELVGFLALAVLLLVASEWYDQRPRGRKHAHPKRLWER